MKTPTSDRHRKKKTGKSKIPNKYNRILVVLAFFGFIIALFLVQLFKVQILDAKGYKEYAVGQWTKAVSLGNQRGFIYDRNNKPLAVNKNIVTFWSVPFKEEENEKEEARYKREKKYKEIAEEVASKIAEMTGEDSGDVYDKITYESRIRVVEEMELDDYKKFKESMGKVKFRTVLEVEEKAKRYYPFNDLASQLIGFNNIDNVGINGLEVKLNEALEGRASKKVQQLEANMVNALPNQEERIIEGKKSVNVVLTIDEKLQREVEKIADEAREKQSAESVSIIVMDPRDSSILALANTGRYNLNEPRKKPDDVDEDVWDEASDEDRNQILFDKWRNNAISDSYEPGSVYKVINLAAGLEEGKLNDNMSFSCSGSIDVYGRTLSCADHTAHGTQDISKALNNSCNVAFVQIGNILGKNDILRYAKAFGFGEKSGVDLPGESLGILPTNINTIGPVELATMSYGHGLAVTPIQMANAICAVVNGGTLYKPKLVLKTVDDFGNVVDTPKSVVRRRVISEETSEHMKKLLESVVRDGHIKRSRIDGYRIGGKTGTAQKIVDGKYKKNAYISSFVGAFPIDKPEFVVLAIVDEPHSGVAYGSLVAAPIFQDVAKFIIDYYKIPPASAVTEVQNEKVQVPDLKNKTMGEAGLELAELSLSFDTRYTEYTDESLIISQSINPGVFVDKGTVITLDVEAKKDDIILTPDFKGMTRDEAFGLAEKVGLKLKIEGDGLVKEQRPEPDKEVKKNSIVELKLGD